MKICVVGNSQVAALRSAIDIRHGLGGDWFAFFSVPGGNGPNLEVVDGRLRPARRDLKIHSSLPDAESAGLDLSGYDGVLFSAIGLGAHRVNSRQHLLQKLALGFMATGLSADRQLVSEAVLTQCIQGRLQKTANVQAVHLIRSVFAGKIVLISWPLPTPDFDVPRNGRESDLRTHYGDRVGEFLCWYYERQLEAIRMLAAEVDASVVTPPDDFMKTGFTPQCYATNDSWHMNKAYGQLMLERALPSFRPAG